MEISSAANNIDASNSFFALRRNFHGSYTLFVICITCSESFPIEWLRLSFWFIMIFSTCFFLSWRDSLMHVNLIYILFLTACPTIDTTCSLITHSFKHEQVKNTLSLKFGSSTSVSKNYSFFLRNFSCWVMDLSWPKSLSNSKDVF